MKMMLDNVTLSSAASTEGDKEGETTATVHIPTPAQREMIESDAFETARFVSHRTSAKVRTVQWLQPLAATVSNTGFSYSPFLESMRKNQGVCTASRPLEGRV